MPSNAFPDAGRSDAEPSAFRPPETFNIADYFLYARLREGRGDRPAILTAERTITYAELDGLANRYGNLLLRVGVRPEERVLIALPDGPEFVAALFGTLKIGAVVVMLNPHLKPEEIAYFFRYTRGAVLLVDAERAPFFREVARETDGTGQGRGERPGFVGGSRPGAGGSESPAAGLRDPAAGESEPAPDPGRAPGAGDAEGPIWGPGVVAPRETLVVDKPAFRERLEAMSDALATFPTHRDDPAIWLFSGGTTGTPKAVVQTHASFANTTECYAKRVIRYRESDVTLSVPKLFFGYATGSNLFFPFAAGGATALFPERCTPDTLFEKIEAFRPTILINVPTMINQMLAHPGGATRDLTSLRLATSAGEALPTELHDRWRDAYGVDLLDGLGTAEMWHIFLSNRPGSVRPGTLGTVVPGFEVRVRDESGADLPDGEVGWLWVRGGSRALGYWQRAEETHRAFRGEWYVSGDMVVRDAEGVFTYCGRGDDMLKVKGKWLSPQEVENCMLQHDGVREAVVVGVPNADGLVEPHAWVVPDGDGPFATAASAGLGPEAPAAAEKSLREFVAARLASYKAPTSIHFVLDLPRTHLGKVDRGALRRTGGVPEAG